MPSAASASNGGTTVVGRKISTVVPATVTGEDVVHGLTNMDLTMKLHYLRGVYYFSASSMVAGLETPVLKVPMFPLLETYCPVPGRIRQAESGRPFIKCNDSGVRIVEAKCEVTLDEWLAAKEVSHHNRLVPDQVIGPDLHFSPLVLVQFTRFKCGGFAVGFSWSHVLGDIVCATNFINLWGQILGGKNPPQPKTKHHLTQHPERFAPDHHRPKPKSIKQVEPIPNYWVAANERKMESFSFHITATRLKSLQSKISSESSLPPSPFEAISALVWQCLAKIRDDQEQKTVTICRTTSPAKRSAGFNLSNALSISVVDADSSPAHAKLSELARLVGKGAGADDSKAIEAQVDEDSGGPDFIVYGANLTFVDMEEVGLYGLELKDQKPVMVNYSVDGVGEEGTVLVFHGPGEGDGGQGGGWVVNAILPEDQLIDLKQELGRVWGIA